MKFILVYQGGLANLFRVPSFDSYTEGANKRVYQGPFHVAETMARGAMLTGAQVRVASCNHAGDIAELVWAQGMSDCPFRNVANPPRVDQRFQQDLTATGVRITSEDSFGGFITLTPTYIVAINGTDYEVKCSYVDHVEVFPYGGDDESVEYRRSLAPVRIEWCDIEHIHVY